MTLPVPPAPTALQTPPQSAPQTAQQTPLLAERLKRETRTLHQLAERSGVMADLLHGRIARPAYVALVQELLAIYTALEAGLEAHARDLNVQRLWRPELARRPALQQDLDAFNAAPAGPTSDAAAAQAPAPAATAATQAYVQRLHELTATAPALLLAHAYVRYLGDLHGGQVLGRLVRQHFALADSAGTAFYELGEPARVELLRREFRAGLDVLDLTAEQQEAFVAEACEAFRMHQQLFDELQRRHPAA